MKLNILYSSNDEYIPIVGVSIQSLLETNKNAKQICIHFIDCGLKTQSIYTLTSLVNKYHREIIFHKLEDIISNKDINAPNVSYYGRLFAPEMTDDNKILYLDCDVIIAGSLEELWNIDISNYSLAAVQGPGISLENRQKLNFSEAYRYINSGVLLINLDYWRQYDMTMQMLNFLNKNGEIPPYHDQNIINAICYKSTLILHPKYNLLWSMMCCKPKEICKLNDISKYYTDKEIEEAIENPIIIHFSNSIYGRPWKKGCHHKYKDIFYFYQNMSPWSKMELEENKISTFRKIRNTIYRGLPSYLYLLTQKFERWILKNVIPSLPFSKLNIWINSYMNGK